MLLNKPRAQRTMKDAGLDALIATGPTNVAYMSDYFCESSRNNKGVQVYGIVPVEDSVPLGLVVPSLEVDSWAEQPGDIADVTVYGTLYRQRGSAKQLAADDQRIVDLTISRPTHGGPVEALVEALRARGLTEGRLGVDETGLLPAMWEQFKTALPKAQITPAASVFQVIRMVKTEEELRRMARSAAITEEAMSYAWADLRDGITEL